MSDTIWPKIKQIEGLPKLKGLGDNMQNESDDWKEWFNLPAPESSKMPGDYEKTLNPFEKLVLLRALRPDRTTVALARWISAQMGEEYVLQGPFSMVQCNAESSNITPTFFVLFPGVDPTPWVEGLGKSLGMAVVGLGAVGGGRRILGGDAHPTRVGSRVRPNSTEEMGLFCNISMGQGQEKPAEASVVVVGGREDGRVKVPWASPCLRARAVKSSSMPRAEAG